MDSVEEFIFSTVIRRPWLSMHFQVQGLGYVLQIEIGIIHDLDFLSFLRYIL